MPKAAGRTVRRSVPADRAQAAGRTAAQRLDRARAAATAAAQAADAVRADRRARRNAHRSLKCRCRYCAISVARTYACSNCPIGLDS